MGEVKKPGDVEFSAGVVELVQLQLPLQKFGFDARDFLVAGRSTHSNMKSADKISNLIIY